MIWKAFVIAYLFIVLFGVANRIIEHVLIPAMIEGSATQWHPGIFKLSEQ